MKSTMADDISGNGASLANKRNFASRLNRRRFLSALISYSMSRRRLANCEIKPGKQVLLPQLNTESTASVCQAKTHPLTQAELSSIQTQLAVLSDTDGDRPIHIAVANENLKLVQKLGALMVKNSISLDITNYLRQTPLHLAVMLGNIEIIKLLFSFGVSPLLSDRKGNSVLHLAVKSSCQDEVFHILFSRAEVKNILNSMDYEGYSPLHYAVFQNDPNAVQILHSYGADMNRIDGKSGRIPLIHAVLEQKADMVELLLKCGACPQKVDYSGRSAFEMALQVANGQIVKLLEKWMPQGEISVEQNKTSPPLPNNSAKKSRRTKN